MLTAHAPATCPNSTGTQPHRRPLSPARGRSEPGRTLGRHGRGRAGTAVGRTSLRAARVPLRLARRQRGGRRYRRPVHAARRHRVDPQARYRRRTQRRLGPEPPRACSTLPDSALDAFHAGTITLYVATALTTIAEHPDLVDQLVAQRGLPGRRPSLPIAPARRPRCQRRRADLDHHRGVRGQPRTTGERNQLDWKTLDDLELDDNGPPKQACHAVVVKSRYDATALEIPVCTDPRRHRGRKPRQRARRPTAPPRHRATNSRTVERRSAARRRGPRRVAQRAAPQAARSPPANAFPLAVATWIDIALYAAVERAVKLLGIDHSGRGLRRPRRRCSTRHLADEPKRLAAGRRRPGRGHRARNAPASRSARPPSPATSTPSNASATNRPTGNTPNGSPPPPDCHDSQSHRSKAPNPAPVRGLLASRPPNCRLSSSAHMHQWCPYASRKPRLGRHVAVVMSLWKLRVGVESYYLAQIASGLDEYYTGAGEAAGRWTGTGSALLGLDGDVDGRRPARGARRSRARHRADTERHAAHVAPAAGARVRSHLRRPEVGVGRVRAR